MASRGCVIFLQIHSKHLISIIIFHSGRLIEDSAGISLPLIPFHIVVCLPWGQFCYFGCFLLSINTLHLNYYYAKASQDISQKYSCFRFLKRFSTSADFMSKSWRVPRPNTALMTTFSIDPHGTNLSLNAKYFSY